jgi:hypothetical protein
MAVFPNKMHRVIRAMITGSSFFSPFGLLGMLLPAMAFTTRALAAVFSVVLSRILH